MAVKKTTKKSITSKTAKAIKVAVGRPTKYLPAYNDLVQKAALLGMTDAEMADFLGVAESTLYLWSKEHPSFSEARKAGKAQADAKVAESLYRAALGGGTVTETREEVDAEGNPVVRKVVKELPANVTAQIFWLKNRQPRQWRDKVVLEDETPPEKLAEAARGFVEIMAEARARQRAVLIERGILSGDEA